MNEFTPTTARISNRTDVRVTGAGHPTRTRIFLNGQEINGVLDWTLSHNVDGPMEFSVTVLVDEPDIDYKKHDDWSDEGDADGR